MRKHRGIHQLNIGRRDSARYVYRTILSLACLVVCGACTVTIDRVFSSPTILASNDWQLVQICRDQPFCPPYSDDLVGRTVRIRIDVEYAYNPPSTAFEQAGIHSRTDSPSRLGGIELTVYPKEGPIVFDPSRATLRLRSGPTLKPRVVTCRGDFRPGQPPYQPLTEPIVIGDKACIRLLMNPDYPLPSVNETFVMHLGGLFLGIENVDVPEVVFQPILLKERKPFVWHM